MFTGVKTSISSGSRRRVRLISDSSQRQRGGLLMMTLVFVIMLMTIFVALAGMVNRTYHESVLQAQDETAFQAAEAGLNYGRWRLAHHPDNFAPETKVLDDQFAGAIGEADVTFEQSQPGSTVVSITSVGRTVNRPERQVTLRAKYGMRSLAQYAFITNNNVHYAGTPGGLLHANGGIRMEGQSDSLVTSASNTYVCRTIDGCAANTIKPGIWGGGEKKELWQFPVPAVDFNALTLDMLKMQEAAEGTNTYYGIPPKKLGYQIVFNDDNTYTISEVRSLIPPVYVASLSKYLSLDVDEMRHIETRPVPDNGVIYTESTVWVKGDIRSRVTVAAGRLPDTPSTNADIILNGNITYGGVKDGSRVFGAVAQRNVLISWSGAPDVMMLDGAYIAQKGSFLRYNYYVWWGGGGGEHNMKSKIIRYGMVASNGNPALAYLYEGQIVSGFLAGQSSYDPNLLYGPPPHFSTTGQYELISWEQLR